MLQQEADLPQVRWVEAGVSELQPLPMAHLRSLGDREPIRLPSMALMSWISSLWGYNVLSAECNQNLKSVAP